MKYIIITFLLIVFGYTIYFVLDYEQVFEAEPQAGEIWGDNPFGVDYKVVDGVKDGMVLYHYAGDDLLLTVEVSKFKRWYDKIGERND